MTVELQWHQPMDEAELEATEHAELSHADWMRQRTGCLTSHGLNISFAEIASEPTDFPQEHRRFAVKLSPDQPPLHMTAAQFSCFVAGAGYALTETDQR
jgi:hypothetical protein